jgi:hypothetical protein
MRQALDEVCAGGNLPRLAGARALRACVASGTWRRGCPYLSATRSRTCRNPKNRGRHQPGRKRTPQLTPAQKTSRVCAGSSFLQSRDCLRYGVSV